MIPIYTLSIFLSAFLIFLIQPMFTKLVLPFLGGTSAVWNTSMVFYQSLVLLGYCYAHIGSKLLGAKRHAQIHIILLLLSLMVLPLTLYTEVDILAVEQPVAWLLAVLLLSVGLPFFLLSANAPLLQSWFARTNHEKAGNPYFLYSASNVGSLIALLGYPLLFEPFFTIPQQMNGWSVGYVVFIGLLVLCAIYLHKYYSALETEKSIEKADDVEESPTISRKLYWIFLAFVPSSLMLGVTSYITTDIASFPLLWVLPLALYLLTFIFAFANKQPMFKNGVNAHVSMAFLVSLIITFRAADLTPFMFFHLFFFFAAAMVCHGQLANHKPSPKYLTEFFLWVSVGGVLGGVFNALIAPVIFNSVIEYQIMIVLSCFARPLLGRYKNEAQERRLDILWPAALFMGSLCFLGLYGYIAESFAGQLLKINELLQSIQSNINVKAICMMIFLLVIAFAAFKSYKRPIRFGLMIGGLLFGIAFLPQEKSNTIHLERNFFGVLKILHFPEENTNLFMHGTTLHGMQSTDEHLRLAPRSYYSALQEVFGALDSSLHMKPVATLGLGIGTIACYGKENQEFDFYEIDQAVEDIARNTEYFTYLADCPPVSKVIIGDGRIKLAEADKERYGLIIMDAFSSDSVPAHLLTTEALDVYMDKLYSGGVIAVHISNRHLDLAPVLSSLAQAKGLFAIIKKNVPADTEEKSVPAKWVVLATDPSHLDTLINEHEWVEIPESDTKPWTDNYSNILQAMLPNLF